MNSEIYFFDNTEYKKTSSIIKKLMKLDILFDNKNRYLGIFILEKIAALLIKEFIELVVDSLKYENNKLPQNK